MFPWMRDKINDRKSRWSLFRRKDDSPLNTTVHTTPTKTTNKSDKEAEDVTESQISLRIVSPRGGIITVKMNAELNGLDLKTSALRIFSDDPNAIAHFASIELPHLITKHKLIRTSSGTVFNDNDVLQQKNVTNNEEFLLVVKRTDTLTLPDSNETKGPSTAEVLEATKHIPQSNVSPPICNVTNLLSPHDLQYEVNRVLISLAKASAYLIGAGPYAERIILMFRQRIINEKRVKLDPVECLIEMGFDEQMARESLEYKNNIFLAALDHLLQKTEESKANVTPEDIANKKSENISNLLQIIDTYCQKNVPAEPEMITAITDMGFDEANVLEALKVTKNNKAAACEWLLGERNRDITELRTGLPLDSPLLEPFLNSAQVQISLTNPKLLIALISMVDDYFSYHMWVNDSELQPILEHILKTYHEEKCINAINQFNPNLP